MRGWEKERTKKKQNVCALQYSYQKKKALKSTTV